MQWNRLYFPLAVLVVLVLGAGGCADLAGPEGSPGTATTTGTGPGYACNTMVDGVYVMCPVTGGPTIPDCDPWASLDWCDGGDGSCQMSVPITGRPDEAAMQGCDGDGGGGGGYKPPPGDPGTICPATGTCLDDPQACEMDCPPPDEEMDSDICPQPLMGKTLTYLATIAGRTHEFKFKGTMRRVNPAIGRSPAWYNISGPHVSNDSWWLAESGTIQLVCWGGWRFRNSVWVGTVGVQADDLHFVMGPGHPDF